VTLWRVFRVETARNVTLGVVPPAVRGTLGQLLLPSQELGQLLLPN